MKKKFKSVCSIILALCVILSLDVLPAKAATSLNFSDSFENAAPAKINTMYSAHSNGTGWITFTTPSSNGYYTIKTITSTSDSWFTGYLYDSEMNQIGDDFNLVSSTAGEKCSVERLLSPSTTYYLKSSAYSADSTANFSFLISLAKDKDGNDIASATKISLKKAKTATMDSNDDVDWFKFKTTSAGTYKFTAITKKLSSVDPGCNLKFTVYTKDLTPVTFTEKGSSSVYEYVTLNPGEHYTINYKLKKNTTYYVQVCAHKSFLSNSNVINSKYTIKVAKK